MSRLRVVQGLMILILICGLLATPAFSASVGSSKRTELVAGSPQAGSLKTKHMTITYNYTLDKNKLALTGEYKFDENLIMLYSAGLKQFNMQILLIGPEGKILQRSNVKLTKDLSSGKAFKADLSLPAQTKAIAFYYSGQTNPGPDGEGNSFWYDPAK